MTDGDAAMTDDRTWIEPTSEPIGSLAEARNAPSGVDSDGVNYASVPV